MSLESLDQHFQLVKKTILDRQDPLTGLLPASTAVNIHGDYTDAWIRDNVYCILAVWGLSRAYNRGQPEHEHGFLLEKSVVRLMRGLLDAMMRQSDRVEAFKYSLDPKDSIHAKFGTRSGLAVVGDTEWGHLQLDAISLYLLQLAQMIASGIPLIYSIDEVNFIQNLVHYIGRSYCTPDYGIWERGKKTNHGIPEINSSSVGMAKAALEALSGFNLFGNVHSPAGIIHVVPSDIARSRFTLKGLLPRESNSKETDAALLSIVGYPAYAIEDNTLLQKTRDKILNALEGRHGCKRFLLDGHQSELEDESRLHYEPSELQKFRDIESEWPLFFCYLLLDALMTGKRDTAAEWRKKLDPLFIEVDGMGLLPELYKVPHHAIEAERAQPGSQARNANENLPLTWAQSLFMLADMISDGVLHPADIDPLRRRQRPGYQRETSLLVPILAENQKVKQQLQNLGVYCETLAEIEPIAVYHATTLSRVHSYLGKNDQLGLTGRPDLVMRTLTTSRIFEITGQRMIFLPYYFNPGEFYLSHDNHLLVQQFRSSIRFIASNWDQPGQPLLTLLVREDMLVKQTDNPLITLLGDLTRGECNGVEVTSGMLNQLLTTASLERITYLHDFSFEDLKLDESKLSYRDISPANEEELPLQPPDIQSLHDSNDASLLYNFTHSQKPLLQAEILKLLIQRHGLDYSMPFHGTHVQILDVCHEIYGFACQRHQWSLVRRMADLLDLSDSRVEDTLLEIIIRRKRLSVGRAYNERALLSVPLDNQRILKRIKEFSGQSPAENTLTQEVILHLGHLLKSEPELFQDLLTLRVRHFIQLMVGKTARDLKLSTGAAYEKLLTFAPSRILETLHLILESLKTESSQNQRQEHLDASGLNEHKPSSDEDTEFELGQNHDDMDWSEWRRSTGGLIRLSEQTYHGIHNLLTRCRGLVIGDKYSIGSQINSEITHDMTPGEPEFALLIETELSQIDSPAYRQLNLELLQTLLMVFSENAELIIQDHITLDIIIGHAVKIAWQENHGGNYDDQRELAWEAFYALPPKQVRKFCIDAIWYLLV